eukprot:15438364-Alexandrium_andersonii.AAC.1
MGCLWAKVGCFWSDTRREARSGRLLKRNECHGDDVEDADEEVEGTAVGHELLKLLGSKGVVMLSRLGERLVRDLGLDLDLVDGTGGLAIECAGLAIGGLD